MKLKVCGLKTLKEIDYINKTDIDYAGFIFATSRNQIDIATARQLKKELKPSIKSVGVFVNESPEFIENLVDEKIIDIVQFHGNFEYEMPCPTIRAFGIQTIADIKPTNCDFVLFDSKKGVRGSCGGEFDWRLIEGYDEKPFFLAGGINIKNIKQAMQLKPYCIDISSGVEENGEKSIEKIMEVINEIKIR